MHNSKCDANTFYILLYVEYSFCGLLNDAFSSEVTLRRMESRISSIIQLTRYSGTMIKASYLILFSYLFYLIKLQMGFNPVAVRLQ
jgi:hypothetical protein